MGCSESPGRSRATFAQQCSAFALILCFCSPAALAYTDLDNDNMFDSWEIANGLDPENPADANTDLDNDLLSNRQEHDAYTNPRLRDTDGDWLNDGYEVNVSQTNPNSSDTDNDGIPDFEEAASQTPAGIYRIDADNDGMPEPWETAHGLNPNNPADAVTDPDKDGLTNLAEYQNQTDPNDLDTDDDWLRDSAEVNLHQSNPNALDTDKDGLLDFREFWLGTSMLKPDTDDDGMDDKWELDNGLNPLDPADADMDADNDGLDNLGELTYKTDPNYRDSDGDWIRDGSEVFVYGTDPASSDTDGDGRSDSWELYEGTDPALVWGYPDTDADGIDDAWETANNLDNNNTADGTLDSDNDTFSNYEEFRLGTDPNDALSTPASIQSYNQSFETTFTGNAWQTAAQNPGDRTWDRYCKDASDGSCSLTSDVVRSSSSWMARTAAGSLSFDYKTLPGANLEVYLDGGQVLSISGDSGGWSSKTLSISGGIHELLFIHSSGGVRKTFVDNVSFASELLGLNSRPQNLTCVAPPVVSEAVDIAIEYPYPLAEQAGGLRKLTLLLQAPDDDDRWYLLEQEGLIKYFDIDDPDTVVTWLDFTGNIKFDGEMGLLGLAFDPDFPNTPEVYVTYTGYPDPATATDPEFRLSRIILDDAELPVSTTEEILLRLDQDTIYHQSGDVKFGDDDMLWLTVGDDSKATEAQDTESMYGSVLRLDVRDVDYPFPGYNIPEGNAFELPVGQPNYHCGDEITNPYNCPEIWSWGFRNAWRWSFDPANPNRLWVGDVGYNDWEEVSIVEAGKNYGWGCFEGTHVNELSTIPCIGPFEPPVFDYPHAGSNAAVIGGFVYRGSDIPALIGRYVFADVMTGRIYAITDDGQGGYDTEIILTTTGGITSFAEGPDNELYFTRWIPGRIGKLVAANNAPVIIGEDVAEDLIDTGCVNPADPTQPASAFVPYDVRAKLWSDGAEKHRAMAIPDGTTVTLDAEGDFIYPVGSVLYKDFWINGKIIETRLLMHRQEGDGSKWEGFSYEWNAEQTEAELVEGGKTTTIDGQEWNFPSKIQCNACHTDAAKKALGPEVAQLNHEFLYESSGTTANQLLTLEAIDYLSAPLGDTNSLVSMPDPFDESADEGERARAYLHANCSGCHRPGSVVPSPMDFRYTTPLESIAACNELPGLGDLGIGPDARLIAPGSAANSVILARMNERSSEQMPPLGTALVDTAAIQLISNWIDNLDNCGP